jgi:hypothetical protein
MGRLAVLRTRVFTNCVSPSPEWVFADEDRALIAKSNDWNLPPPGPPKTAFLVVTS